jgi:hypothetical protein
MLAIVVGWYLLYLAVLPGRLPVPGQPSPPMVTHSWYQLMTAVLPASGPVALWLKSRPALEDLTSKWLVLAIAEVGLWLIAFAALLWWQWRMVVFALAWAAICWLPMLSTHTAAGHYVYIPQLMVTAAGGTVTWAVLAHLSAGLRRELRRLQSHRAKGAHFGQRR